MNSEYQQVITILLGGVLIWGIAIGLGVVALVAQKAKPIRTALAFTTVTGINVGIGYLLLLWGFQNDIPKLSPQIPGIILGALGFMLATFLSVLWHKRYFDWRARWLMQRAERKRMERESKNR